MRGAINIKATKRMTFYGWMSLLLAAQVLAGTLKDDFNDGDLDGWTHDCSHLDPLGNVGLYKTKTGDSTWKIEKGILAVSAERARLNSFHQYWRSELAKLHCLCQDKTR